MTIGWLTALKVIPWGDVIEHAPAVLKGARRLLERSGPTPAQEGSNHAAPDDPAVVLQKLHELQLQHATDMAQMSQTVAELAEQNARLVQAVDALRWRTRWLGAAFLAMGAGLIAIYWKV